MAAQAETINLYGWQNHSWEFVDIDGGRSFDRIQSNAGNIGFGASVDTGMDGIHVTLQCEQFTYYNHFAGGTGWCNRNSKIGLKHPMAGEIMLATWLLPYNEGVAQWVDPFYDAGADSHTSIMGSVGAHTIFYNTGDFDRQASDSHHSNGFDGAARAYDGSSFHGYPEFNYSGLAYDTGFNRRQENIIQYWSPDWNGFVFRFAWTAGIRDETTARNKHKIDPVIRSSSLAYTNGPLWLAVTWQDHEDWTAASIGCGENRVESCMESSDAESFRLAGRYIMDMGDGVSVQVSAMWEDLEYEFNGVPNFDTVMGAFGFPGTMSYGLNIRDEKTDTNIRAAFGITGTSGGLDTTTHGVDLTLRDDDASASISDANLKILKDAYDAAAKVAADTRTASQKAVVEGYEALIKNSRNTVSGNGNVKVEREAWMVSGKVKFGGPVDLRFSYMDADDLEVDTKGGGGDWSDTAADAWNVGLFYTTPGGTELRLTYSEVDNDKNGSYGQGISGTGLGTAGSEIEMVALGIVHWFD